MRFPLAIFFARRPPDESGRREVYVRSFPESVAKQQVSTRRGTNPVWSRDGTELFYREGDGMMTIEPTPSITHLNLVQNWFEELERLVPTDN